MQGYLQEREKVVGRCGDQLWVLSTDRAVLNQAQDRAHAHNTRINKAREDIPKLERQLHEQAPQRAYDMEVQAQQRAVERDRERELSRGRGRGMSF